MVPMWRTAGSPIRPASLASTGSACCTTGEVCTSLWRVSAPIVTARPVSSMPVKPSVRDLSLSTGGLPSRSFMVGSNVCPPASSLASAFLLSRFTACRSVWGRSKVKLYISVLRNFSASRRVRQRAAGFLQRGPYRLRRCRHGDVFRADGVRDGVDDRGGRSDGAGLAAAFDAERVGRTLCQRCSDRHGGEVIGARHGVVHERAGHELASLVVDRALAQCLADALRDAAVDLALDNHRIDDDAEIVHRRPGDNLGVASLRIDLDLADMATGRESEIGRIVERGFLQAGLEFLAVEFVGDVGVERHPTPRHGLVGTGDAKVSVLELDIAFGGFEEMRSDLFGLRFDLVQSLYQRRHADRTGARTVGAHAELHLVGIAVNDRNAVDRHAKPFRHDLSESRLVALAVRMRADQHFDRAGRIDANLARLPLPDAATQRADRLRRRQSASFDVSRKSDAAQLAVTR